LVGHALYVKFGSNGMMSSITTLAGRIRTNVMGS
jgi:hypothetical protein